MSVVDAKNNEKQFNPEVKQRYIEDLIDQGRISEKTAISYNRIFVLSKKFEEKFGKDLSKFSREELEEFLHSFNAKNATVIWSYGRIVTSYLSWCVDKGMIEKNILSEYTPKDFEKFVTQETYITNKQLIRYEDSCENFQDSVILRLIFIGVAGKQLSEMRNLSNSDIDYENKRILLKNTLKADEDGFPIKWTERWIDVDDRTLYLINNSFNQRYYATNNEEKDIMTMNEKNARSAHIELANNDYIIRPSVNKAKNWLAPASKHVIYRRLKNIQKLLGIDLTAKLIERSGMVYYAKELYEEVGELTTDEIRIVANRYGSNSHGNLRGFLTKENIERTYPHI